MHIALAIAIPRMKKQVGQSVALTIPSTVLAGHVPNASGFCRNLATQWTATRPGGLQGEFDAYRDGHALIA
jgi:hypothetical protein